jgi:2-methylisocitrate lyase-like PEP mutase family enzyme
MGRPDYGATRDGVLAHLTALVEVSDLPINADFENGFAHGPQGVADNVALAVATGVAGLSVEDATGDKDNPLYDFPLAVERIAAARAAIDASGGDVLLTARTEGFIRGRPDLAETLRRIKAFAEAGADCLYAPGLSQEDQIAAAVAAAGGKPVNVLTFGLPVATLAGLGVRRISVGGALALAAYSAVVAAGREIIESGTFSAVTAPAGLNALFAAAALARGETPGA